MVNEWGGEPQAALGDAFCFGPHRAPSVRQARRLTYPRPPPSWRVQRSCHGRPWQPMISSTGRKQQATTEALLVAAEDRGPLMPCRHDAGAARRGADPGVQSVEGEALGTAEAEAGRVTQLTDLVASATTSSASLRPNSQPSCAYCKRVTPSLSTRRVGLQ
jgi:hypothetical protein